ncbi:PEP-CTERM sorting domain-containing protein [bacterium]|nr:PEP-CTERM sorting domain-containing protein [bacterium]
MRIHPALFLGLAPFCQLAEAVVVVSGGPNNSAPVGQAFFGNVGTLNGASAIYLTDGWVLTASHVAGALPAAVSFGGISYATQAGSFHRLGNESPMSTLTDMVLFRLSAPPALPGVDLSQTTPTVGSRVMMIGNGRTQAASPTYWNRTVITGTNNDTWAEVPAISANIAGFKTTATQEVRWGENLVDANGFAVNAGAGDVVSFSTQFDAAGLAQEAQAVTGDSGGAVFFNKGSSWELAGMMFAVSTYEMQPGGSTSAVVGVQTAIADLSYYRDEILAIVPEPSTTVLALFGVLALGRRRR